MPIYLYECPVHGEFDVFMGVNDPPGRRCPCGKSAKRRVCAPAVLVTKDGFERNNYRAVSTDLLHDARMENKRHVEERWGDVESGKAEYSPGKTPEAYQPRQYVERKRAY